MGQPRGPNRRLVTHRVPMPVFLMTDGCGGAFKSKWQGREIVKLVRCVRGNSAANLSVDQPITTFGVVNDIGHVSRVDEKTSMS